MFMVALDNLVVSTALRTFAAESQPDTTDLQWFVNAHVLSFACLLLTGTALGDGFGRRRLFVLGIAAFSPAGPVFPGSLRSPSVTSRTTARRGRTPDARTAVRATAMPYNAAMDSAPAGHRRIARAAVACLTPPPGPLADRRVPSRVGCSQI